MDGAEVAAGGVGSLKPGQVGVHDLAVPVLIEDEGDVDRDAAPDDLRDRRDPGLGGGDLHQEVLPADGVVQLLGLRDGGVGVVRELRRHLDRHAAVEAAGAVVDGLEEVRGVADVGGGGELDRLVDVGEALELLGVGVAVAEGGGEDRRVGGHTHHGLGLDEFGEVARGETLAGEVVEPDGDAGVAEGLEAVAHGSPPMEWGLFEPRRTGVTDGGVASCCLLGAF